MDLRKTHKISKKHFTKHMRCNNNKITTLNTFWHSTNKHTQKNVHYLYVSYQHQEFPQKWQAK